MTINRSSALNLCHLDVDFIVPTPTRESLESYMKEHPDSRTSILSPYTIVHQRLVHTRRTDPRITLNP